MNKHITIQQYKDTKHNIYETINIVLPTGNTYKIYKSHIDEYNGAYHRCYGVMFTLKCNYTSFSISRTKKQSIINYMIKNDHL